MNKIMYEPYCALTQKDKYEYRTTEYFIKYSVYRKDKTLLT